MEPEYKLVPTELPSKAGRKRVTTYERIITDFVNGSDGVVRVELAGKKLSTIALQLRRAVKAAGAEVTVVQREDHVYLVRR